MKKAKLATCLLILSLISLISLNRPVSSEPPPERSGGREAPYHDTRVNLNGHTVEFDKDLPPEVAAELKAKKENALDDIIGVYEQVDWSKYSEAACLDKFLIQGCNDIVRAELRSNKNARVKVKDFLTNNPDSNAKYILLAIIRSEQMKDADIASAAALFTANPSKEIRFEAIKIIALQNDKSYLPELKKILSSEKDKCLRVHAAEGMAKLGEQAGYDEISEAAADADAIVRISAFRSLGEIGSPKAQAIIEKLIKKLSKTEKNPSVRSAMADSLRKITGLPVNEIREKYLGEKFQ